MLSPHAVLWLTLATTYAVPVDDPIKVDLPVYDQPQAGSDVFLAKPLESENAGGEERSGHSLIGGILAQKLHKATGLLENKLHNTGYVKPGAIGWFPSPVTSLEGALLETEGFGSQKLSVKDNLHHFVAGIFQFVTGPVNFRAVKKDKIVISSHYAAVKLYDERLRRPSYKPKPLLDTIREEEKYGNHGDKFYSAGKALVGQAEGVSNLVNSVLEVPGNIVKKITRIASEKLNQIGGKLVGL